MGQDVLAPEDLPEQDPPAALGAHPALKAQLPQLLHLETHSLSTNQTLLIQLQLQHLQLQVEAFIIATNPQKGKTNLAHSGQVNPSWHSLRHTPVAVHVGVDRLDPVVVPVLHR